MRKSILVLAVGTIITVFAYFCVPLALSSIYKKNDTNTAVIAVSASSDIAQIAPKINDTQQVMPVVVAVTHIETPNAVKGIYMSQCVAGTPSFREKLVKLVKDTELNSIVIDIKDSAGKISFPTNNEVLKASVSTSCGARDMISFISHLHENNIYVIGRITTFQDLWYTKIHPELAVKTKSGQVWRDSKGQSFIDAGAKQFWEYIVELGKESHSIGFDELNFDYIRFPSDGNLEDTYYSFDDGKTKSEVIKEFFSYLHDQLKPTGVKISADLFGMTTTAVNDMGIGQVFVDALPYFDYVAPMVYPSHYGAGWNGFKKPADHPYEVVKIAMDSAVTRAKFINQDPNKIRPWLQDFNMGAIYTESMVRDQIKATNDSGLTSWLLWSAANTYTEGALVKEIN